MLIFYVFLVNFLSDFLDLFLAFLPDFSFLNSAFLNFTFLFSDNIGGLVVLIIF